MGLARRGGSVRSERGIRLPNVSRVDTVRTSLPVLTQCSTLPMTPLFTRPERTRRVRASKTCSVVALSALSLVGRELSDLGFAATPPERVPGAKSFVDGAFRV
jgi:hypothetical protein